jgi:hypothetical protein
MDMIKQLPHRAAQVEELNIDADFIEGTFNKRTLLNTFPNVRILEVEWGNGPLEEPHNFTYFKEPIKLTHSTPKVKVLHDSIYCELASQLLASNLCGRLEELTLDFAEITGISTSTVMGQLKNLPVLKKLELSHLCTGVNELETMHQNLPTIQELKLVLTRVTASETPANVSPGTLINKLGFYIDVVEDIETHIQLYQYMLKKYNNAACTKYHDVAQLYYEPHDAKRLYFNGILGFYKIIRPNEKKMEIQGTPDGVNIFEVFDNTGCQIEELQAYRCGGNTFVRYLSQSNQSRYIQTLSLINTEINSPDILKNMMALTTLKLSFHDDDGFESVNLTNYLNGCPTTLKSFSIDCPELTVYPRTTLLSSIETLCITCDGLTRGLGDVVSTCFPKLVRLDISAKTLDDNDINISLQNQPLKSAKLSINEELFYGFIIKTPSQPGLQLYICFGNSLEPRDYETTSASPTLSFTSFTGKILDPSYHGIRIIPG